MERSLRDQLESDLKQAMRADDRVAKDAIRFTMAALKNAEIERGGPLTSAESLSLLQRETKRRADSIEQFRAGNRPDLVEREEAQLAVVKRYLPAAMDDDQLKALVAEVIAEVGASGPKDMGRVMPIAIERAAGRADGRRLSTTVREALAARS
jgi:uncharacterized protein YqeY